MLAHADWRRRDLERLSVGVGRVSDERVPLRVHGGKEKESISANYGIYLLHPLSLIDLFSLSKFGIIQFLQK